MAVLRLSGWSPLTDDEIAEIPDGPGVYEIRCHGKEVCRALDADPNGILDIGESKHLRRRLEDFLRCASHKGVAGHMAGWRYSYLNFKRYFPLADLQFRWAALESKENAVEAESKRMLSYLDKFGELPPLNYKFNWEASED